MGSRTWPGRQGVGGLLAWGETSGSIWPCLATPILGGAWLCRGLVVLMSLTLTLSSCAGVEEQQEFVASGLSGGGTMRDAGARLVADEAELGAWIWQTEMLQWIEAAAVATAALFHPEDAADVA